MNTRSVILTAAFLGIIIFFGFGVYSGIIELKKPQNLLGLVGIDNPDGFNFVGGVNLENSSSVQNSDYFADNDKKEASAPVKIKKEKKSNQVIVKVISGAPATISATTTVFTTTTVSATVPDISSTIAAISPIEVEEPVQIQEKIPEEIPKQSSEQTSAQTSEQIQEQIGRILVSEIMAGIDGNANYEFIELYNPNGAAIDLTGYSIKKRSSTGSESTLVSASRFEGKIIPANKHFLLANEGGYGGQISPDIFWPKSYILAYSNNALIIYNADNKLIEEVGWTEIPKDKSIERVSWDSNEFKIQSTSNPQNSNSD